VKVAEERIPALGEMMTYYKTFANHPNQNTQFQGNDRVVRIKDGKPGTFKWEPCPMNGHNDAAGAWMFEMDYGEKFYLNGSAHNNFPWRIPNRFRHATEAVVVAKPEVTKPQQMNPGAEQTVARICDLVDMVVRNEVTTEDYNYVVEELTAMVSK